jgi:outer membrane protein
MRRYASFIALALAVPLASGQDLLTTYEQAQQRDPLIHQAEATRNAALENKPQSIARLLPTLSVTANLNRNWILTKSGNPTQTLLAGGNNVTFWNTAPTLTLSQPVYHHELWVQLSQADNQVAQAEAEFEAAQQNLMLRTANAYFDILYAQDSLEFSRMERESIERQLEQANARFEVGLIAITDVNAAKAGFDQARANEIKSENDLDNAREAMRVIIGQFDGKVSALAEDIPLKPAEPADMEAWNQRAQENNLLIIAANNQAEQAQKAIDLKFAGHLPTLDLVGTAGFTDNNRPNGIRTEFQVISMQLNLPLFQGGLVNSQVRQAREQFMAAAENLDVQRRNTRMLVKTAFRGIATSISQVAALKSAVDSAQSALEATLAGFEVGTRTMIDVLIQQRNLYQVKRDYAKTRYDYIKNSLTLKQSTGTLSRDDVEMVNHWLVNN